MSSFLPLGPSTEEEQEKERNTEYKLLIIIVKHLKIGLTTPLVFV
jgi:hypothetical protein